MPKKQQGKAGRGHGRKRNQPTTMRRNAEKRHLTNKAKKIIRHIREYNATIEQALAGIKDVDDGRDVIRLVKKWATGGVKPLRQRRVKRTKRQQFDDAAATKRKEAKR